jgi:uncharacterized protein YwgA
MEGRKRFQKTVFLLRTEKEMPVPYTFIPYLHGPYSKELQMDLNLLCLLGLVDEKREGFTYQYALTDKGKDILKGTKKRLSTEIDSAIRKACKEYSSIQTPELVARAKNLQSSESGMTTPGSH